MTRFEKALDRFEYWIGRLHDGEYVGAEEEEMDRCQRNVETARAEVFRLNREAAGRDSRALTVLMLHLNESLECPLCGVSDGEHEPDEPCGQAQAILGGDDV